MLSGVWKLPSMSGASGVTDHFAMLARFELEIMAPSGRDALRTDDRELGNDVCGDVNSKQLRVSVSLRQTGSAIACPLNRQAQTAKGRGEKLFRSQELIDTSIDPAPFRGNSDNVCIREVQAVFSLLDRIVVFDSTCCRLIRGDNSREP